MNNCNLCIYQGDDWAAWVTVLNCADGTPADLTGYTAQAQIRSGPADQSHRVSAEITATVCPPNNLSLSLASQQTTWLRGLFYCWDLQLTTAAGLIITILRGNVQVSPQVTREWKEGTLPWDAIRISPLLYPAGFPYPGQPAPLAHKVYRGSKGYLALSGVSDR